MLRDLHHVTHMLTKITKITHRDIFLLPTLPTLRFRFLLVLEDVSLPFPVNVHEACKFLNAPFVLTKLHN